MRIDIWSDVVCPWCYIGKRRFEKALSESTGMEEIEVVWRSFELDPRAPTERTGDYASRLAKKYGMSRDRAESTLRHLTEMAAAEGLDFDLDSVRPGNTFDAHRLLHLAASRGVQDRLEERLMAAYFSEGEPIGDHGALTRLAVEAGLDGDEVAAVLAGDEFAEDVRADEAAADDLGIGGVPFFLVDGKFAVAGAQAPEVLGRALERAWAKR